MSTHMGKLRRLSSNVDLTEGSIARGLIAFALPLFLGQLLQQLYNMTDAWVVGNFASNDAFAAVSLSGNLTFLIVGFFNGIAIGGGVVISRYFGARDDLGIERSIHANFLFGLIASVLSTIIGLILSPILLRWMNTPESVMGDALTYFRIYFGGVSTVIMYNICMAIMRAVGDSLHPLYYLMISSASNVVLDLLFVAVLTVEGMSCRNCSARVESAFNARTDTMARVNLNKKRADVYTKQPIDDGELRAVVARVGYGVSKIERA